MDKVYTAVVIGCGKVGATFEMDSGLPKPASHAAAFVANPRTKLVGLVDPDAAQLKRAGDYYNVPTYADPDAALAELTPDIVVVATPPPTHEELLMLALKHGARAIICEKPVSGTLEAAQRMIVMAQKANAIVVLNHQRRFFPLFRDARERIAAGELGRIQQVSVYYGNGLLNNATHSIDAVQFLLNDTAAWAIGVENTFNTAAPFGNNIDGMLGLTKGTMVALQSLDNDSWGIHDLVVMGTKGALVVGQYGMSFTWVPVKEGVTFAGVRELDWKRGTTTMDKRSMMAGTTAHVVERLDGSVEAESTLKDGYHTMQALDALVRSAASGGKKITI